MVLDIKDETAIINPGSTTTAITTTPTEFKIEVKTIPSTIKHIPTLIKWTLKVMKYVPC